MAYTTTTFILNSIEQIHFLRPTIYFFIILTNATIVDVKISGEQLGFNQN